MNMENSYKCYFGDEFFVLSDQIQAQSRNNGDSGSCSETMPHIYILKDTSCCGFPSLPQCAAVEGKKLGCIDTLGKY